MAIPIEGYTVVVKRERIQPLLDEEAFEIPNRRVLADDHLWICSFMAEADAERLLEQLQRWQLNTAQGPDPDAVITDEYSREVRPYCEWLVLAPWDKAVIAWLAGTEPRTVTAREGWDPKVGSGLSRYDPADEDLEFVRLDDGVEVYRSQRTGKELYVGRIEASPEAIFKTAWDMLRKHWVTAGEPAAQGEARNEVASAVQMLHTLTDRGDGSWRVFWLLGKGELALGNLDAAYGAFHRAYELEKETEAILRELGGVCLELRRFDEAIQVTQRAVALDPTNADLLSNLALSYLLAGRIPEAQKTIAVALGKNGTDPINLTVDRLIMEVATGRRPPPQSMADLQS